MVFVHLRVDSFIKPAWNDKIVRYEAATELTFHPAQDLWLRCIGVLSTQPPGVRCLKICKAKTDI